MASRPKLIILTCMRSYSSLISGMLGQHSGLYTLPEINPFVADTLGETTDNFEMLRPRSLDGIRRLIAELEFGGQSYDRVNNARDWLAERRDWTPHDLMEHVAERLSPRIAIEKSPATSVLKAGIPNALRYCPDAYYLHLYRHPVATTASIAKVTNFGQGKRGLLRSFTKDPEVAWYEANIGILNAARDIPRRQFLSVRGEDVLSDPDTYLAQIAAWMGLETTLDDLDAMRRPELSPFARFGPANAPYGADANYLENPKFVQQTIKIPSLNDKLTWADANRSLQPETVALAQQLGYGDG